jgi:hypothetical protein
MSVDLSSSVAPQPSINLDRLPLAALQLGTDGSATAVNVSWREMTRLGRERSVGRGWLRAIEPVDRDALTARLRGADVAGTCGSIDCRLVGAAGPRWSRWWWRPESNGGLVACVADISNDRPQTRSLLEDDAGSVGRAPAAATVETVGAELANTMIHGVFAVGLTLESVTSLVDGVAAERLQDAVGQLDTLIKDIRTRMPALVKPAPSDDPAAAVRDAVAALIGAEQHLATTWSTVVGDHLVDGEVKDRLAQAARLAHSAVRALRPDTLH